MKVYSFAFISLLAGFVILSGCVENTTHPSSYISISVSRPLNNDTINLKTNMVEYDVIVSGGIKYVEMYINGTFAKTFISSEKLAKPLVKLELDSSYANSDVIYKLRYYDYNGMAETSDIKVFVKK